MKNSRKTPIGNHNSSSNTLTENLESIQKCFLCGSDNPSILYKKKGSDGIEYNLLECPECRLQFLDPSSIPKNLEKYYGGNYFLKRDERGYDNYFTSDTRKQIERVFKLNLHDLGFFNFEKSLSGKKTSLDLGCAAGYFVNYLSERSWSSKGIDISKDCIDFACGTLKADAVFGDYMKIEFSQKFDLITLWATIEHLPNPENILEKINFDLSDSGRIYISTCRTGFGFGKFFGKNWRYYNFPEHIFFFSYSNIKRLLRKKGFAVELVKTYGSGFGKGGSLLRKVADLAAKYLFLGDMMIISAKKIKERHNEKSFS